MWNDLRMDPGLRRDDTVVVGGALLDGRRVTPIFPSLADSDTQTVTLPIFLQNAKLFPSSERRHLP
ncbi:hypothetical protein ASD04_03500 [Devosia sp. Root436]|nr:hypothetical protein ASD04_03500 [Devosia sp. Root436]